MISHIPIDPHLELEPRDLGIPLHPQRVGLNTLWVVLASVALAWLWHRPTTWPAIAISCTVGGLAWGVCLTAVQHRFQRHRSAWARGAVVMASVLGAVLVMTWALPFLHRYVA